VHEPEIICREFVELVTDYLDGALPATTVDLVEEHLVMCDWCRDYLDQFETTSRAVAEAESAGEEPSPAMLETILGAVRARASGGS
jgi:predicted anti-sigma-YlaC factor YlaD